MKTSGLIIFTFFISLAGRTQVVIDSVFIVDTIPQIFEHTRPSSTYDATTNSGQSFLSGISGAQLQISAPGGLTTLLHRGMGSRHLPVVWEGINIQSMVNGSYDLNLIPLHLYDGTQFYSAGAPTLTGCNALSGAINIAEKNINKSNNIGLQLSTLKNIDVLGKFHFKSKNYIATLGGDISRHQNEYYYTFNQTRALRADNWQHKYNLIHDGTWFVSKNQALGFNIWHQESKRAVPAGIVSGTIHQLQNDRNTRINVHHTIIFPKGKLSSYAAMMNEYIGFLTPSVDSRANVNIYTAATAYIIPNDFSLKMLYRTDIVNANFFSEIKSRNQINIAATKSLKFDRFNVSFSARQDFVDKAWMPISLTGTFHYQKLNIQISRNYNLPGLNDLYWPSSGNLNLKTELSHQGELKYTFKIGSLNIHHQMYLNHVKNWIQWIPTQSGLWVPMNQKTVLARGVELQINKSWSKKSYSIDANIQYHFNRTTATDHYFESNLIGKQLIYVPVHTLTSGIQITKARHGFTARLRFSGLRYYTPDNEYFNPPYYTIDIFYHYKPNLKFDIIASIMNVTNHQYEIVRFFPLPGINGNLSFKHNF